MQARGPDVIGNSLGYSQLLSPTSFPQSQLPFGDNFNNNNNTVPYQVGATQSVLTSPSSIPCQLKPMHENSVTLFNSLSGTDTINSGNFTLTGAQSQFRVEESHFDSSQFQLSAFPQLPSSLSAVGSSNIELSLPPNGGRAASWVYVEKLKKLYIRINSIVPIRIHHNALLFGDLSIRITAVYNRAEHANEPVRCCLQHQSRPDEPGWNHLVRVAHQEAQYLEDVATKRQSVVVPVSRSDPADSVTLLTQFSCFSSCVGGQNRRPISVIFSLERVARRNSDGALYTEELGRCSLEVRACACPRRDAQLDAQQTDSKSVASSTGSTGGGKRKSDQDSETYTLVVRGLENYRLLKRIRDAIESADRVRKLHCANKMRKVFKSADGNDRDDSEQVTDSD